jgi:hypothetical protein
MVLRHAAAVDHDLADLALEAAHVVDLRAQDVRQPLDRLDREADRHQVFGDRGLSLVVGG